MTLIWLQKWKNRSINRSIFVAIGTVGFFTLISKLTSMLKDLFVARSFGLGSELDALLVSLIIPSLIINLVGSSFNSSLIPAYVDVKTNKGPAAARELLCQISGRLLLILLFFTLVLGISGPLIISLIGSQFDLRTLQLSQTLYLISLPNIVISGMSAIWSAILNAEDEFAIAAIAPIVVPIAMIIALIMAPSSWGIYALSISMMLGFFIQAVVVGYSLQKHGLSLMPEFRKSDPVISNVLRQFLPALSGGIFAYSTDLVDQTMAAILGVGSVSILNYGSKITSFSVGIASVAISSAVLPYFSKLVATKDWSGVKRTYRIYALLIFFVFGAATLLVIIFSEPLIKLIFEHGAFTEADTKMVSYVQNLDILQVPFFAISILTVRLLSALKRNHVLAQAAIINGVINITLNYLFMRSIGVAGIALSTSCVYIVTCLFLLISLNQSLEKAQHVKV